MKKIHRFDCYDLRRFNGNTGISHFIDIGANVGATSIMAKILLPCANIIALEPHHESFQKLVQRIRPWQCVCRKIALGPPSGYMINNNPNNRGMAKFVPIPTKQSGCVKSMSLPEIFEAFNIDYHKEKKRYIIKIDVEGGECFLLQTDFRTFGKTVDIIRNSLMTIMELHIGRWNDPCTWRGWFKLFQGTHNIWIANWIKDDAGHKILHYWDLLEDLPQKGRPNIKLLQKSETIRIDFETGEVFRDGTR